ncbi:hypothetical protein IMZ48_26935 [Candidatus Bathyarchaeota archaeon]|nr:hypothetical protein [Candidatus Bathyarchaeota archaeon]
MYERMRVIHLAYGKKRFRDWDPQDTFVREKASEFEDHMSSIERILDMSSPACIPMSIKAALGFEVLPGFFYDDDDRGRAYVELSGIQDIISETRTCLDNKSNELIRNHSVHSTVLTLALEEATYVKRITSLDNKIPEYWRPHRRGSAARGDVAAGGGAETHEPGRLTGYLFALDDSHLEHRTTNLLGHITTARGASTVNFVDDPELRKRPISVIFRTGSVREMDKQLRSWVSSWHLRMEELIRDKKNRSA